MSEICCGSALRKPSQEDELAADLQMPPKQLRRVLAYLYEDQLILRGACCTLSRPHFSTPGQYTQMPAIYSESAEITGKAAERPPEIERLG